MRNIVIKLERMWLLTIPVLIIMVSCADFLYKWWVGEKYKYLFLYLSVWLYMFGFKLGVMYICILLMELVKSDYS